VLIERPFYFGVVFGCGVPKAQFGIQCTCEDITAVWAVGEAAHRRISLSVKGFETFSGKDVPYTDKAIVRGTGHASSVSIEIYRCDRFAVSRQGRNALPRPNVPQLYSLVKASRHQQV
jgi:hypothetical protein